MNGDFELEIGSGSQRGEYTVRVVRAPAGGEPSARFQLDIDGVLDRRADLENTILATAVPARRTVPPAEKPMHDVGQHLFQTVFTGSVNGTYRASLGAAQRDGRPLRVVLRLATPELAALPWEMLFDPETESYLCRTRPLLRHIPAADYHPTPLEVAPPLRILGVVASPRNLPSLDTDVEKRHLAEALAVPIAAGRIELVWAPQATWEGIQTQLLAGPWHVLHFIGHGDYDTHGHEGRIALVADDDRAAMIESSRLTDLLGEAEPTPRLVVLNSCSSGQAGEDDLFAGTAAALVRGGVNAVAAMQFTVSDTAAIAFARGFYTAIAAGRDVDKAANSGRVSILGHGSLEWVTPVLYVRGGSTRLFTLTGSPVSDETTSPVRPGLPPAALKAMYIEARGELRRKHYESAIGLFDDLLALDPDYRDAAVLQHTAQHSRELAEAYQTAQSAEGAGDWETAVLGYSQVLSDPAFPDAEARKQACEHKQQITDLQEELRHHADAENWQTVLEVDTELTALDPDAADPDGLTTHARSALRYAQARGAEDDGDWETAARGYTQLRSDPAFPDADTRKQACERQLQITDLQEKLRHHADAENWQTVLEVDTELTALDPNAADPDRLTTHARSALLAAQTCSHTKARDADDDNKGREPVNHHAASDRHGTPHDVAPDRTVIPKGGGSPWWRKMPTSLAIAIVTVLVVAAIGVLVSQDQKAAQTELSFSGLNGPSGVAVSTNGDVYVADTLNNRVLKLTDGTPQTKLPFNGLNGPQGIAVSTNGDVYVTDTLNNRVLKLTDGTPQTELPFTGLNGPQGIAVSTNGDVYVTDTLNNRVLKLAARTPQTELPFTGLNGPQGVAVSSNGDVYVADYNNDRVVMLPARSSTQTELPFTGLNGPSGVAVNTDGDVHVTDTVNDRVMKVAAGSSNQTELPFTGLNAPRGVAINADSDIFVTDTVNDRILELTGA